MKTLRFLACAGFAITAVGILPSVGFAATYSFTLDKDDPDSDIGGKANNDCSGYYGSGFDACNVRIDGTDLSAVIAKWDNPDTGFVAGAGANEVNNTIWPNTLTGDEFAITNPSGSTWVWNYTPGANDPLIKYWVHKQGPGFTIYWSVLDDPDSVCTSPMTLACMQLATTLTTGTWQGDWSHITWYDSEAVTSGDNNPQPVPLPAAFPLLASVLGAGGLVAWRRRRKSEK